MDSFEVGKTYKSKKGVEYTLVSVDEDKVVLKHLNLTKRSRIVTYCGVKAIPLNFGEDMILAEKIKPVEDVTIEYGYNNRPEVIINNNGESYVNLFKRHKEEN